MAAPVPEWATKEPCLMGIDEAGRGPVLGPMVHGCMYCARSYNNTLASLKFAVLLYFTMHRSIFSGSVTVSLYQRDKSDSKTLKEEQREELFESLKVNNSIGWEVDVICPKDLSAKMLKKSKVNLNEISHNSAMSLVRKVLDMGVLLSEVYIDTVGDPEKYRIKLTEKFPGIKFVVAKKADSLYPVVSGASIVAKVTRDRALRNWVFDETALSLHMKTGSGYPGAPDTKQRLEDHKHPVFGFPTLVRFSWETCKPFFKDAVEVTWESDEVDEDGTDNGSTKRQVKLSSLGFTGFKRKTEEIESSGKGRCKFFQARKLELVRKFQ
ncbi:ribonuclease H2 subunit A-like [Miscanthus floridulus]|uniref:ribonuclease H2 subunit A-like n=1 Tax=Miscanthus floridulus TaxID=154761 RepID=UPI003458086A